MGDPKNYSYQATTGDPRVWVFDMELGGQCIGWINPTTNKLIPFISEGQSNDMLAQALKRKPKS